MKLIFLLMIAAIPALATFGYDEKLPKSAAEPNAKPVVAPATQPQYQPVGVAPPPHPASADGPSDPGDPGRESLHGDTRDCAMPSNTCKALCMDSVNAGVCLQRCMGGVSSCAK